MAPFLQSNFVNSCLTDLFTIHLTIIGVCFTIFTLLYSFIFTKRIELNSYSEELKSKLANPLVAQKYGQAKKYILKLATIISRCKYIFLLSSIACILSWFDKLFCLPDFWEKGILCFLILITLIEFILIIIWGYQLFVQYKKEVNV